MTYGYELRTPSEFDTTTITTNTVLALLEGGWNTR